MFRFNSVLKLESVFLDSQKPLTLIPMKLAVVGATGLVGTEILEVLQEHQFPYTELLLVASARSKGKEITYNGEKYLVMDLE